MTGIIGGFYSLIIALANLLLQAFFKVLLLFGVLFLIGVLYPYVARAWGLPYITVWQLLSSFVVGVEHVLRGTLHVTY